MARLDRRLTPGQLRRRAARLERRADKRAAFLAAQEVRPRRIRRRSTRKDRAQRAAWVSRRRVELAILFGRFRLGDLRRVA